MSILDRIFRPAPAEPTVEAEILRDVIAAGVAYNAGSVVNIAESVARALVASDAARVPAFEARALTTRQQREKLLPPPYEKRPLREGWEKLPPCFAAWWQLNEDGLSYLRRRDAIEDTLISRVRVLALPDLKHIDRVPREHRARILLSVKYSDAPATEDEQAVQAYLRDALRRAADSFDEWNQQHGEKLLSLQIACGDEVLRAHGQLARTARELAQAGFDIFSERVRALGLAEFRVRELYRCGADFQKYEEPAHVSNLDDVRFAGFSASGEPRAYLEKPTFRLAELFASITARDAELQKLLKQAQGELAKARKVAA